MAQDDSGTSARRGIHWRRALLPAAVLVVSLFVVLRVASTLGRATSGESSACAGTPVRCSATAAAVASGRLTGRDVVNTSRLIATRAGRAGWSSPFLLPSHARVERQ